MRLLFDISKLAILAITVFSVFSWNVTVSAQTPSIGDYGRLPEFEDAAVSENGDNIAMLATVDGKRYVVLRKGENVIKSSYVGDVKVRDISWAGNDHLLIRTSQTEGLRNFNVDQAEFSVTTVVPMSDAESWTVFAKQRDILSSTFGQYGIRVLEGTPYLFTSSIPLKEIKTSNLKEYVFQGGNPELYKVNLETRNAERIGNEARDGDSRQWLIDESGTIAARLDMERSSGNFEIRDQNGDLLAQGSAPNGNVSLTSLNSDGTGIVYYISDDEIDRIKLMEVPLTRGEAKEILPETSIERIFTDKKTGKFIGYRTDTQGKDKTVFFDADLDQKIANISKAFPTVNSSLKDWSSNFDRVIVRTDGNGDSGSWFNVDMTQFSANAIGYERPKIFAAHVGKISTVSYKAEDGLEIDAILTLPPGLDPKALPVVILPHGGPTSEDTPSFDWWAQAIAARGYAVLQPNFRGSTNRDRAFVKAGYGEWGRKMQTDLSDGLAHLAGQGIVDPDRVCIMGASYGGYAALAGVTLQKGLYRCAVSVAGISDLTKMVSTDIRESGNDPIMKRILKEQIGQGRDLKDVSPRRFAEDADAPILLIHGEDDVIVPFEQSYKMADALKDAGKPYKLIKLDAEDHWLSKSETRLQMLTTAIEFLENHNPPD